MHGMDSAFACAAAFDDANIVPGHFERGQDDAGIDGDDVPTRFGPPSQQLQKVPRSTRSRKVLGRQFRSRPANGAIRHRSI